MTRPVAIPVDMEPLPTSAGFAVLSGLLSVVDPYFIGLTIVLAAFTASLWATGLLPRPGRPRGTRAGPEVLVGIGILIASWGPVLADPRFVAGFAGLCLGSASGLLWLTHRRRRGTSP